MGITTTIPTNLDFPHRGELERDAFVNAQEIAQDLLSGSYTDALNQYATELNNTEDDINTKWSQVQNQAVSGSYSQAYIDGNFVNKAINSLTAKTTPVDADLLYLGDSVSSFSLKKLTWANIKATLKTYTDTLYVALTGNQSIDGTKTFVLSPIVPTPTTTGNVITMDNIIQKTAVGIGYGTGSGGTVTQLTNRTTTVTINKPCGTIVSASGVGTTTWNSFLVNNSIVGDNDTIVLNVKSGATNAYEVMPLATGSGSFYIWFRTTGGTASDTFTVSFSITKGANS